jgi:hypothetical protein
LGEERKVCKVLVGKSAVKRPIGRPRPNGENWIRIYLRAVGWLHVWSGFRRHRIGIVVGSSEHDDEPSGFGVMELTITIFAILNIQNTQDFI